MRAKRVTLVLGSGLEVRLFGVEDVHVSGTKIFAQNHNAALSGEWDRGTAFGELYLSGKRIDLGPVDPRGMKFMEDLAKH